MTYTTYDTLTVWQYQQLYNIHTGTEDELDKIIQSVCVLTGLSERGVEDLPMPDFNKVSAELATIFKRETKSEPKTFININGKRYGVIYNPNTLTAGQYVEIQTWMKSNVIDNLHKIFASLVYEVKGRGIFKKRLKYNSDNHAEISEAVLQCRFVDVYSTCVFFLNLWNDSIKALVPYLQKEGKLKGVSQTKMQDILKSITDGYIMQSKSQSLKV
jgi:hypothetical protein